MKPSTRWSKYVPGSQTRWQNPPLVDLCFRNDNTIADHSQISNQETVLHAVARGKYRSKIDFSDAYFQTRVHPDDVKYNSIKTSFGGIYKPGHYARRYECPSHFR